jgi:methyl-accepting chemotaxis protein
MSKSVALVPQQTDEQPQIEGTLRDILQRADSELRKEGGVPPTTTTHPTELVRRLAGTSAQRVERVVLQLQSLSDQLRSEGERVNGELARYINLNDHATSAMQSISAALDQLSETHQQLSETHPRRRA